MQTLNSLLYKINEDASKEIEFKKNKPLVSDHRAEVTTARGEEG